MKRKEIAKFFAGFAANQVLTHGAFAAASVQFSLFGITYSQGLNTIAAGAWAIILLLLTYYAWIQR
ncbi:hypothetical protein LJ725_14220 [Reyranella aquatilis]|jgi:hypothetical protein|uniref:Uncharacterized protein n=1 Tax=Reyranella aquatilis TaxID=2035356 RepID=A0ABS8KVN4_9HYPH|nr:hypothetical protein [Reyranella aquatilis]MCC8430127.1 hypothetical protein [Reyranella aquatilis]